MMALFPEQSSRTGLPRATQPDDIIYWHVRFRQQMIQGIRGLMRQTCIQSLSRCCAWDAVQMRWAAGSRREGGGNAARRAPESAPPAPSWSARAAAFPPPRPASRSGSGGTSGAARMRAPASPRTPARPRWPRSPAAAPARTRCTRETCCWSACGGARALLVNKGRKT